ncbi:MAG: dockerin type I domain-containing protein [Clostridiales bacterium]|nr:dockerin type I domain-containing protein [Clostridiales bacterium]
MLKQSKLMKPVLIWLLVFSLVLPLGFGAGGSAAYAAGEALPALVDASAFNAGVISDADKYLQGNKLPYTGYFEQKYTTLTGANAAVNGREARIYIPEGARLREYFIVLALPSGENADTFLESSGWNVIADKYNVGLIVLLPRGYSADSAAAKWGSYAEEAAYVNYMVNAAGPARTWYSTFGMYYFAGYGDGGAILQQWAANNPMFVISQAYAGVKEADLDPASLIAAGNRYYNRDSSQNTNVDAAQPQTDKTFRSVQKCEIPVPTLLIGDKVGNTGIAAYWLGVNEWNGEPPLVHTYPGGTTVAVFSQDKANSNAIATSFSDVETKVAMMDSASVDYAKDFSAADIYEFLTYYTRYDNTSSLGNALAKRINYLSQGNKGYVDGYNGIYVRKYETATLNSEYQVYIPTEARDGRWGTAGAPVVFLFGGGSQPSHLFFDITGWADVAKKHGLVIVAPCARVQPGANNNTLTGDGGVVARWSQTAPHEEYQMVVDIIAEMKEEWGGVINPDKIFGTGQSTGGGFTTFLSYMNPNLFAAFGATSPNIFSSFTNPSVNPGKAPAYFIVNDYEEGSMGNNARNYWRNRNGFDLSDNGVYARPYTLPETVNNDVAAIVKPDYVDGPNRYTVRTWYDASDDNYGGLPMVNSGVCYGRAHNNIVSDAFMQWEDWFSKWSWNNGVRVYDDSALVLKDAGSLSTSFTAGQRAVQGNRLPYNGYFGQEFTSGAASGREARFYIPEGARMREYFVTLALPDKTGVTDFLINSGWKRIADSNNVCLMILLPTGYDDSNPADVKGVWGSYENNAAYVNYLIKAAGSARGWYSVFGLYYFVGYGEGGDVLQQYAASEPLFVIGQAYFDSTVQGADLAERSAGYYEIPNITSPPTQPQEAITVTTPTVNKYTFDSVKKSEVPVPTVLIGDTVPASAASYWKNANECPDSGASGGPLGSKLFTQLKDGSSKALATSYTKVVSQMAVLEGYSGDYANYGTSREVYDFLARYTRYDNTSAWGNALADRVSYTYDSAGKNGVYVHEISSLEGSTVYKNEYLIYIPDNALDPVANPVGAPAVYLFAGGSQPSHLFFDIAGWADVAKDYGIIIVVPCGRTNGVTASWSQGGNNVNNDYNYVLNVMADVEQRYGNVVDMNRLYVTGQSAGGAFTDYLSNINPNLFTAFSATSPAQGHPAYNPLNPGPAPSYIICGEHDNRTTQDEIGIAYWLARNADVLKSPVADGYVVTRQKSLPSEFSNSLGYIVHPNSAEFPGDRYTKHTWFGKGDYYNVPMYNSVICLARAHNGIVSDAYLQWEDWFSKWSWDDGVRVYSPDPVSVSILVGAESDIGKNVEVALSVSNAVNVLTVEAELTVDGNMLSGIGLEPLSGFTAMNEIFWSYAGGGMWKGTATLAYQAGEDEGFTSYIPAVIAKFVFAPRAAGDTTIKLASVRIAGLREGTTRYLDCAIAAGEATTNIDQRVFSKYDLNRDNAVDALDLGIMLLYCGFDKDSPDWGVLVKVNDSRGKPVTARMCDVNGDGVIDMLDLLDLFIHYTK